MFRSRYQRVLLAPLVGMALLLAACGGESSPSASEESQADRSSKRQEQREQQEARDGVAATVDGHDITADAVKEWYTEAAKSPQVASQLESPQADQVRPALRAQILSRLIVSRILIRAASDEFGIKATEADVDKRFGELIDELGSKEELDKQLQAAGMTEALLRKQELPLLITLEQVQTELAPDEADAPPEDQPPAGEQAPSEAELALQQWGVEQFTAADVSVHSDYGTWSPERGEVVPPGGGMAPPPPNLRQ